MQPLLPHNNPQLKHFLSSNNSDNFSRYDAILKARQQAGLSLEGFSLDSEFGQLIAPLFELSDYLYEQLNRFPQWLDVWPQLVSLQVDKGAIQQVSLNRTELLAMSPLHSIAELAIDFSAEANVLSSLRRFRNEWLTRLIYLDFLQAIELQDLTFILSELADVCVKTSVQWAEQCFESLYGHAIDSRGKKQSLIVIGMGKLGGGELNLSSDIDLIFAFRERGETVGGKKSISHEEYFTKLGQKLIHCLDKITFDGFVFRVDMRLRPYGDSGPLATNLDSLENYYQDQGRDWERYAMIKARVMMGDDIDHQEFEALRRPFVYRKYLDFGAIAALRDLKKMIAKEVRRKGIEHNVKLGQGGIREIEFIAQALQILHGGRDTGLQTQSIYQVLPYLKKQEYLPAAQVDELWQAYILLRRVEHALQAIKDDQTHLLPEKVVDRERLAIIVGYSSWSELDQELIYHRGIVSSHFAELIEDDEDEEENLSDRDGWRLLINHSAALSSSQSGEFSIDKNQLEVLIGSVDWQDKEDILNRISRFLSAKNVTYMQPVGQERLAAFLADLIKALSQETAPDIILIRTLPILEAILRRTSYLVLLVENPTAVAHLIQLNRESVWFSEIIASMPLLLDELLDAHTLFSPADKNTMADELRQILLRLPEDDDESHMDALRRFRHSIILRVAACDITGILPVMKVSDHLTWLAEVILEEVLNRAWHHLTHRHGFPLRGGEPVASPELVIVGYGKSGGWELGYDSDLDLVFVHNTQTQSYTNGERSIDNLTFYTRLGQRIIHTLTSFTSCGRLYEVDMRLRPSGNSGLLVTGIEGFKDYQTKDAWTWEHQALTRARVLCGDSELSVIFTQARHEILSLERDIDTLKQEVIKMRQKMRDHLDSAKGSDNFDLKQGEGGVIDIEFMVQFLVLAWARQHPKLTQYSDNMRQIETAVAEGVLGQIQAETMMEAYKLYRSQMHRLTLQKQNRVIAKELLQTTQEQISMIWNQFVAAEDGKLN